MTRIYQTDNDFKDKIPTYLDCDDAAGEMQMVFGKFQGIPMPYTFSNVAEIKVKLEDTLVNTARLAFQKALDAAAEEYNRRNPENPVHNIVIIRRPDDEADPYSHALKIIATFPERSDLQNRLERCFTGPDSLARLAYESICHTIEEAIRLTYKKSETPCCLRYSKLKIKDGRLTHDEDSKLQAEAIVAVSQHGEKLVDLALMIGTSKIPLDKLSGVTAPFCLENRKNILTPIVYVKYIEDPINNGNWVLTGEIYREISEDGKPVQLAIDPDYMKSQELKDFLKREKISKVTDMRGITLRIQATEMWKSLHCQNKKPLSLLVRGFLEAKRNKGVEKNRFNL